MSWESQRGLLHHIKTAVQCFEIVRGWEVRGALGSTPPIFMLRLPGLAVTVLPLPSLNLDLNANLSRTNTACTCANCHRMRVAGTSSSRERT